LYGAVQARDYLKAREINDRLKASARDYPSSKVDSVIAAHTLASDFALNEAKAHLLANRSDLAAEKIKSATEIWPTNPGLEELRRIAGGASVIATARNDFDRLISEGNFREILRRQYEIAPAIQGDAARESAFREVIGNLTVIETALGKAAEFTRMGQHYAAWEQLAELRGRFPDDPKLGRELELLAPKVADFTKALDAARQLEERIPRQTGSAISWYLKARSLHPQSKFASEGIQRLVVEILPTAP
jgi:tetratricopeptide (TPR) repeat protein